MSWWWRLVVCGCAVILGLTADPAAWAVFTDSASTTSGTFAAGGIATPAAPTAKQEAAGWLGGRPIIVTDLRDPSNPVGYSQKPVDLFRQDGVTAYAHDVDVDDAGAIGRRYRRQDEIGTPFCLTVDFESLEDRAVTVRERDTMAQTRVAMDQVQGYLAQRLVGA